MPKKYLKTDPRGLGGGGVKKMFFSEFLFILFRGHAKCQPYDMPFCGLSNRVKKREKTKEKYQK